jgi:hypothetical protein
MEMFKYSYFAKVHCASESGCVGFGLEGEHGQRFIALLSIADAERLAATMDDGPADMLRVDNGPDVPADMLWLCSAENAESRFYFFNETKDAASESSEDGDAEAAIKAARPIMWAADFSD